VREHPGRDRQALVKAQQAIRISRTKTNARYAIILTEIYIDPKHHRLACLQESSARGIARVRSRAIRNPARYIISFGKKYVGQPAIIQPPIAAVTKRIICV
jgi:hypothetical protein